MKSKPFFLIDAFRRKKTLGRFDATRAKTLWESKTCPWKWAAIRYGIYNGKARCLPIRNESKNHEKVLTIGVWRLFISFVYHRGDSVKVETIKSMPLSRFGFVKRFYYAVL